MTDRFSFEFLRSEYEALWAKVRAPGGSKALGQAQSEAVSILSGPARWHFQIVEARTAVPWFVVGIILTLEAGSPPNFEAWLYNGDPMFDRYGNLIRTRNVPRGQPPDPRNCTWEDGACLALKYDNLTDRKDWSPAFVAWALEKYNGFGYREFHHIPSPYVWGGTIVQKPGKYVKDRQFDPHVMDEQIGGMALLAALMRIDPSVKFESEVTV